MKFFNRTVKPFDETSKIGDETPRAISRTVFLLWLPNEFLKRRPNGASSLPLAEQLELDKCVLVLGPCAGLLNGESLPVGTLLAHALGRELSARVPEPDDLPMVATAFQRQFEGGRLILEHTAAKPSRANCSAPSHNCLFQDDLTRSSRHSPNPRCRHDPFLKVPIHGLPSRKIMRQVPPYASVFAHMKYRFYDALQFPLAFPLNFE